jgi:hypothetical protein
MMFLDSLVPEKVDETRHRIAPHAFELRQGERAGSAYGIAHFFHRVRIPCNRSYYLAANRQGVELGSSRIHVMERQAHRTAEAEWDIVRTCGS